MRASLLLLVALAGCTAATPAPPTARLSMHEAQRSPHGAWINVVTEQGAFGGELLAIEPRDIVIETPRGVLRVPRPQVRSVSLAWYEADNSPVIAVNVLGTLSTLSHGVFLIFTAPILWWTGGTLTSRAQSRQGLESVHGANAHELQALQVYARFPAGLPRDFGATESPEGRAGQRCFPNRTCDEGLRCEGGVCRPAPAPPGAPP